MTRETLRTASRILVLHTAGTLVPTRREIRGRFLAPPVINDDGVVAFEADDSGWSPTAGRWRLSATRSIQGRRSSHGG